MRTPNHDLTNEEKLGPMVKSSTHPLHALTVSTKVVTSFVATVPNYEQRWLHHVSPIMIVHNHYRPTLATSTLHPPKPHHHLQQPVKIMVLCQTKMSNNQLHRHHLLVLGQVQLYAHLPDSRTTPSTEEFRRRLMMNKSKLLSSNIVRLTFLLLSAYCRCLCLFWVFLYFFCWKKRGLLSSYVNPRPTSDISTSGNYTQV